MNKQLKHKTDTDRYAIVATTSFDGRVNISIDAFDSEENPTNLVKWCYVASTPILILRNINSMLRQNGFEEIPEDPEIDFSYVS